MPNTNYKLTLRRRLPDGTLEVATYRLEHLFSSGGDDEQMKLLAHMEMQANNGYLDFKRDEDQIPQVRVWVDEE